MVSVKGKNRHEHTLTSGALHSLNWRQRDSNLRPGARIGWWRCTRLAILPFSARLFQPLNSITSVRETALRSPLHVRRRLHQDVLKHCAYLPRASSMFTRSIAALFMQLHGHFGLRSRYVRSRALSLVAAKYSFLGITYSLPGRVRVCCQSQHRPVSDNNRRSHCRLRKCCCQHTIAFPPWSHDHPISHCPSNGYNALAVLR